LTPAVAAVHWPHRQSATLTLCGLATRTAPHRHYGATMLTTDVTRVTCKACNRVLDVECATVPELPHDVREGD